MAIVKINWIWLCGRTKQLWKQEDRSDTITAFGMFMEMSKVRMYVLIPVKIKHYALSGREQMVGNGLKHLCFWTVSKPLY